MDNEARDMINRAAQIGREVDSCADLDELLEALCAIEGICDDLMMLYGVRVDLDDFVDIGRLPRFGGDPIPGCTSWSRSGALHQSAAGQWDILPREQAEQAAAGRGGWA